MDNITERFAALTRARKGTTSVIIVEESVLAELIGDAQASEAALMRRVFIPADGDPHRP